MHQRNKNDRGQDWRTTWKLIKVNNISLVTQLNSTVRSLNATANVEAGFLPIFRVRFQGTGGNHANAHDSEGSHDHIPSLPSLRSQPLTPSPKAHSLQSLMGLLLAESPRPCTA